MMGHNHNILLKFKRLGAAIQLAQWWDELEISRTLSQLGRVLVIYGYNQAPLEDQAMEPPQQVYVIYLNPSTQFPMLQSYQKERAGSHMSCGTGKLTHVLFNRVLNERLLKWSENL